MTPPALRLSGLAVPFGAGPGLEAIALEVREGERLVIVGPSGAGKTTLLRAIAGLAAVHAGSVEVKGRDVGALPAERRDVVYLHQAPLLFPHLSVAENVAFPLRVRGVPRAAREAEARRLLESVGLGGFGDRPAAALSGGQKHRVALARAMAARPALLLLDEPFAALDPTLREEVRETTLATQREFGLALLMVTHDLDEAGILGDRIGVLLDGRLAQLDAPQALFARPRSAAVARFLGLRNEVRGVLRAGGVFDSVLGSFELPDAPAAPGPAVALFGPAAVRAVSDPRGPATVLEVRRRLEGATAVVRLGSLRLEVRVDDAAAPRVGDPAALSVDPARLRIFLAGD